MCVLNIYARIIMNIIKTHSESLDKRGDSRVHRELQGQSKGGFACSKLTVMVAVQITHEKTPKVTSTKAKNANKQVQTGENLLSLSVECTTIICAG